ncbi:MAG: hypothetical protein FK734_09230 [Asgard group archaeon]|nr:hypothetical protein [Asgard group archaeon]
MPFLRRLARSKRFNFMVGVMGIIAITLTAYNLYLAPAVDKIFAFNDLVMLLLLLGTFAGAIERVKK